MTDTDTPTRDDLERLEELRDELTGDLEQARGESRRLAQEARTATREGKDPTDLIDSQVRAAARVATYEDLQRDLEAEIEEAREVVLRAEAQERLRVGLLRAHGSVAHQLREDEEKAQRLEKELERAREQKRHHAARLEALAFEARVLAARYSLPEPPLTQGTNIPLILDGPFRIEILDDDRVRVVGEGGRGKKVIQGETGRLLATGGEWERTVGQVEAERKASQERKDEELRAACERVDDWLRGHLKEGPAARDRIMAMAEEAGFPIHPTNNTQGASVLESRHRLGVLPLERRDGSKTSFWALPDLSFDGETFRVFRGESRRSREMTSAMR